MGIIYQLHSEGFGIQCAVDGFCNGWRHLVWNILGSNAFVRTTSIGLSRHLLCEYDAFHSFGDGDSLVLLIDPDADWQTNWSRPFGYDYLHCI